MNKIALSTLYNQDFALWIEETVKYFGNRQAAGTLCFLK
jgi:hypothetical protein